VLWWAEFSEAKTRPALRIHVEIFSARERKVGGALSIANHHKLRVKFSRPSLDFHDRTGRCVDGGYDDGVAISQNRTPSIQFNEKHAASLKSLFRTPQGLRKDLRREA